MNGGRQLRGHCQSRTRERNIETAGTKLGLCEENIVKSTAYCRVRIKHPPSSSAQRLAHGQKEM